MKHQPRNRIWSPYHDSVHDFRVVAEFAERFPHLQFLWFCRHTPDSCDGLIPEARHMIQFRTDRAGVVSIGLPRSALPRSAGDYSFSPDGPRHWTVKRDMRCSLSFVVQFWLTDGQTAASHPFHWLEPARIESTPFKGDLDSILWSDLLEQAA